MTRGVRKERASDPARAGDATMSLAATRCLAKLREKGGLVRLPGGYWVSPGAGFVNGEPSEPWDIASTIEALIRRGLAEYSAYGGGVGGARCGTAVRPTTGARR